MRQHLRVLLLGTAMLAGSSALAFAQPGPGSGDRGHGCHHGGVDGPRSPAMSPRQGYDPDYGQTYGRTNQRGYGASPYHGQFPDYRSMPEHHSDYRSGPRQGWQSHGSGHYHGHHHQYDDQGSGYGHGDWERQRGPHFRSGHAQGYDHPHGGYGPHRGGDWQHYDGDRRDRHFGGDHRNRHGDRHRGLRDSRTRDAMGFHGMRIDTNDDGMISPDEAAAHAEMIFVLLDRNMDGVLSRDDGGKHAKSRDRGDRRESERPRQGRDDRSSSQAEEAQSMGADAEAQAQAQASARASARAGSRSDEQRSGRQGDEEDSRRSQWGQLFRDMDQDDDGRVTMEEFMSYHEERYNELAGDEGDVSPWRYRASWHGFSSDD